MNIIELIRKKRDRGTYSEGELTRLIQLICDPSIPDFQISAALMAIFLNGMNDEEIAYLTKAMALSGDTLDFSQESGVVVDKHSTGGVGDKTSLVLIPLLNAAGLKVAKLSGRGLGHTGGTLDKLSVFQGFKMNLNKQEILAQVNKIGMVITGQTEALVPADKRMYALRDLTATVDAIPLIASSIMSKKIAAGAKYILLDVKVGKGAMLSDESKVRTLAQKMVSIGNSLGVPTIAVLTDMNIPLGKAIGNTLEVKEAILTLQGKGDVRFRDLCIQLASRLIALVQKSSDRESIDYQLNNLIDSGIALEKFRLLIEAQGGDPDVVDNFEKLPLSKYKKIIYAKSDGYVNEIHARRLGIASMLSGAGRLKKEDNIDLGAGVYVHVDYGSYVRTGDPLLTIFANDRDRLRAAEEESWGAITLNPEIPDRLPLIIDQY